MASLPVELSNGGGAMVEPLTRRVVALRLLRLENPAADLFFGMLMECRHMQVPVGRCAPPGECEIRERMDEAVQVFLRAYTP